MSYKRSRATYEADLTAQQSPYVLFGTPLPPLDPEVRDDGSYVPLWKQEVRDERGRKRLHGAFTGGWSAGYFNTVGSKEGWTPSTFVSSRTNRRKDDPKAPQQRPEDFMDEEDLAEAEESRKIQTQAAFAGLGSTADDTTRASSLMGLFRAEGETMGTKLLRKMGWKDGQGIGPKVRRTARLGLSSSTDNASETYLFAPENVPMISFIRKTDHKGLGYAGEGKLTPISLAAKAAEAEDSDEDDDDPRTRNLGRPKFSLAVGRKKERDKARGGIGIGILNDTGSDDEDPYEIGPRISYNRVIGGDKKKKKTPSSVNHTLKTKPTFKPSSKSALGKIALGIRKCHDGRLPLEGFIFGKEPDALTSEITTQGKYPPPKIPPGWTSSKTPPSKVTTTHTSTYTSAASAAKASTTLDPKARAALLGEKQLPGKSVFDFMSADARARLASATGRTDLPPARGEIPAEHAPRSEEERARELLGRVPRLDRETALAAIARGAGAGVGGGGGGGGGLGNVPYADDEAKRGRYIAFLEWQAGFRDAPGWVGVPKVGGEEEWMREMHEFYNCARIFKPMTGFMASRFTTSKAATSTPTKGGDSTGGGDKDLLSKPAPPPAKPQDPAEEAAKLGMFGPLTRSVTDFYPTRLLCKRFNVRPPEHVMPDDYATSAAGSSKAKYDFPSQYEIPREYAAAPRIESLALEPGSVSASASASSNGTPGVREEVVGQAPAVETVAVDSSRNDALEGKRAGDEVFKAIFGDSDDED